MSYLVSLVFGYLLAAVPSTWIIGRVVGHLDMRSEKDGRISAAAVYERLGLYPFLLVVMMDMALAAVGPLAAGIITSDSGAVMAAGVGAMCGHNWSPFLGFKGGQGATAIAGVFAAVYLWQFASALAIAGLVMITTHRPTLSTALGVVGASLVGVLAGDSAKMLLGAYPLILFSLMLVKRFQIAALAGSHVKRKNEEPAA